MRSLPDLLNMNNSSLQNNGTADTEHLVEVVYLIWKIFSPILLVIGTAGNTLSIIVLSQKSMRKSGASRYLICLALTDLLVLYIGLLRQWIIYQFDTDIRDRNSFICKVNLWLLYFSLDMSAWILVSVTIERVISVWKPHKVKIICSRKVFVVNIVALLVVLLGINGHFMGGVDLVSTEEEKIECGSITMGYEQFQSNIFPWIDLVLFCLGPFLCHIIGNSLIIIGLVKASRAMSKYMENDEQKESRQQQISSMTIMLLSVNFVYLICTLPICIYFIDDGLWQPEADANRMLMYACVNLLMYLNNSTNFITYIVSGRRFRAELWSLLRNKPLKPTSSMSLSASLSRSQTLASSFSSSII